MKVTDLRAQPLYRAPGYGSFSPLPLLGHRGYEKQNREAAQIKIWTEEGPVYDSGRQKTISSLGFEPALILLPPHPLFLERQVWGDAGDSGSAQSWV